MKRPSLSHLVCALIMLLSVAYAASSDTLSLTFKINGIKGAKHTNALERIDVDRDSFGTQLTEGAVRDIFEQSKQSITTALEPYGYFHASVKGELTHKDNQWLASYQVEPGPETTFNKIDIQITGEGKDNAAIKEFLANFPITKGVKFTAGRYKNATNIIFNVAHAQGFPKIKLTQHNLEINLVDNYANVILHFDTGPRYYFGNTTFDEKKYNIDFLRRFLNYKPGEPYSPQKLQKLQSNLSDTKYFNQVTIKPSVNDATDNQVPIEVDTTPVPSQQYNIGLGYGTNTGARTSLGVNFNRITDTGQHASAILNLSEVNTGLNSKYYIPGPQPAKNQYTIGANIQEFDPDGGKSYYHSLSTGFDTKLADIWHTSSNINYLHERFEVGGDPYNTVDMFYPSFFLSRINSNDATNPTKASRASIMLRAGGPAASTTFGQGELSAKWIRDITKESLVIIRGNIGATYGHDLNDEYPLSLRFFAGGVNSVRGYGEQDLGPGNFLQVASIEFQHQLHGSIYGSVFFDMGNAEDTTNMTLKRGIGTGLVWHSAIGPVALYIAQANSSDGKPLRIELSLGSGL